MPQFADQSKVYTKIFTGNNQEGGLPDLNLGYTAKTKLLEFPPDQETPFHYPYFTQSIPLSASSLIYSGAVGGNTPQRSDRIYKKMAGYDKYSPFGQIQSGLENGKFFCSWLYQESLSGVPIWLDRYFQSGTLTDLSNTFLLSSQPQFISEDSYVWSPTNPPYIDIPSQMTLDPGVLYRYFHVGNKTLQFNVSSLAGDYGNDLGLFIKKDFDDSRYQNVVTIGNTPNFISIEDSDIIPGTSVSYSTSYNLTDEFSISFWVHNRDWNNSLGYQLVGNARNGGWGIFYNTLDYYPYFVITEKFYGHACFSNGNLIPYRDKNIIGSLDQSITPIKTLLDGDRRVWILENKYNSVYLLDYSGNTIAVQNFGLLNKVFDIVLNNQNQAYVLTQNGTYFLDTTTAVLSSNTLGYSEERKSLGVTPRTQNLQYLKFTKYVLDVKGTYWYLEPYLNRLRLKKSYINPNPIPEEEGFVYPYNVVPLKEEITTFSVDLSGQENHQISIDPYNRLWILHGFSQYSILDLETQSWVVRNQQLEPSLSGINQVQGITFIRKPDYRDETKLKWYALLLYDTSRLIYEVDIDNLQVIQKKNLLNSIDILTFNDQERDRFQFQFDGDPSGYHWNRLFNFYQFDKEPQLEFKIYTHNPSLSSNFIRENKITIPGNFIDGEWYLITGTLSQKKMSLYVNGILKKSITIPQEHQVYYNFHNSLEVGREAGENETFNTQIQNPNNVFLGNIQDVRVFRYFLDPSSQQIIWQQRFNQNRPVSWNIPIPPQSFIEQVQHVFKHKIGSRKSSFYNLRLINLGIEDPLTRQTIEASIRKVIKKISPAYTELKTISWEN